MQINQDSITLKTCEPLCFVEITDKVKDAIKKSKMKDGLIVLTSQHTTSAICINEKCDRLQEDMKELLTKIAPPNAGYKHNHSTVDGRSNAHSHLMSMLLKTTETVAVVESKLQMGAWQTIFFIELDGPRGERKISLMLIGEFA